jgi:predicted nucleic acid-binding Zn ribbon protein
MTAGRQHGRTAARQGATSSVGEVLRSYLARTGFVERLNQAGVVGEWPRIVGDKIAAVSEPESVTQDGTLFVRVKSAPWMQELQLLTPELLKRLRGSKIKRIVWRAW